MIEQTVERLVAASEKPDLHYRVTMLNSQSVNAFALPSGQIYVTRGLIALANDESELASVLAHEMGHVVARHAEQREEEARNADLASRTITDVVSDPEIGALALAKSKLKLVNFSRSQEFEADALGIGIAARAGYDPYGAVRFLTSMEHNSDLKAQQQSGAINPAAPDFLSSHPATPERITNALANARQYRAPAADTPADLAKAKATYFGNIQGIVFGEDPSEGFVRGRRFLHPKLGFTFTAPDGFALDNTARRHRGGERRSVGLPPLRHPLRQRRLPLHLRHQTSHARDRPHVSRIDRHVPAHESRGDRAGQAAASCGGNGCTGRHGGEAGRPHGGNRPRRRAIPRAQRARTRRKVAAGQRS